MIDLTWPERGCLGAMKQEYKRAACTERGRGWSWQSPYAPRQHGTPTRRGALAFVLTQGWSSQPGSGCIIRLGCQQHARQGCQRYRHQAADSSHPTRPSAAAGGRRGRRRAGFVSVRRRWHGAAATGRAWGRRSAVAVGGRRRHAAATAGRLWGRRRAAVGRRGWGPAAALCAAWPAFSRVVHHPRQRPPLLVGNGRLGPPRGRLRQSQPDSGPLVTTEHPSNKPGS